jgi:cytochrome c-type biogenesis protein CcmH
LQIPTTAAPLAAGTGAASAATPPVAAATPFASVETIAAAGILASNLNCPLCQGYTLRDCPLVVCAQMRELIVQKLAAGESEEAIVSYFVDQYGPQVLNQPLTSGFQLAAWIVPVVMLVLGLVVALMVVRRNSRAGNREAPSPAAAVHGPPDPTALERAQELETMVGERS